jgi:RNA polymerase sigma-70 factor (ECF subfamily)
MEKLNFNTIYKENYNGIFNFIRLKVKNIEDVEDLTSQVFIKVSGHINNVPEKEGDYNPSKKFSTWIYTIAKNCVNDYLRKSINENKVDNVSDFVNSEGDETFQFVDDSSNNNGVENNELKAKILKAIKGLSPNYRSIAYIYFIRNMQYLEIAETYNLPIGTVKGFIFRVREMLQHELRGVYQTK